MPAESVRLQWKSTVLSTYTNRWDFYIQTVNKVRTSGMFPSANVFDETSKRSQSPKTYVKSLSKTIFF